MILARRPAAATARPSRFSGAPRRALTLTELLVAIAIAGVFFTSVLVAFVQILKASEEAEAQVSAVNQARAALRYISDDLAAVRFDSSTPQQYFLLENRVFAYGDGRDNDFDGSVDEDPEYDGRDNGDTPAHRWNAARDDRHALIATFYERPDFVGYPDLGDANVDEDCLFGNDRLRLRIPPDPLSGDTRDELITYELGDYTLQGRTMRHTLLRTVVTQPGGSGESTITEPVAFNILGLDILAWNSNNDSTAPDVFGNESRSIPYWTNHWDARVRIFPFTWPFSAPPGTFPFEFPTSAHVAVTVYSGRVELEELNWTGGQPVETITLSATTNIEPILNSLRYRRFLR